MTVHCVKFKPLTANAAAAAASGDGDDDDVPKELTSESDITQLLQQVVTEYKDQLTETTATATASVDSELIDQLTDVSNIIPVTKLCILHLKQS